MSTAVAGLISISGFPVFLIRLCLQGAASVRGASGAVPLSMPAGVLKHWVLSLLDSGTSFSQGAEHGMLMGPHAKSALSLVCMRRQKDTSP